MLAHVVGPGEGRVDQARHGNRIDDMSGLALFEKDRNEGAKAVEYAVHVDPENPLPVARRRLPGESSRKNAGVVAQDMNLAEAFESGLGERTQIVGLQDIGPNG